MRLVIGAVLGVVICQSAARLLGEASASSLWPRPLERLDGLPTLLAVHAMSLAAVGAVAGAGSHRGLALGAAAGTLAGALTVAVTGVGGVEVALRAFVCEAGGPHGTLGDSAAYGLPVFDIAWAAAGGWLGGRIWRPLPRFMPHSPRCPLIPAPAVRLPLLRVPRVPWAGRTRWLRALAGTFVAIGGGILGCQPLLGAVVPAVDGYLRIENYVQRQMVAGEIFGLAILAGGCVAGACTPNGLKQGTWVGAACGTALVTVTLLGRGPSVAPVPFLMATTLVLAPLGGWFGTELLPPACARPRRREKDWD